MQTQIFNLQDSDMRINNLNDFIECTLNYNNHDWFSQIKSSDLTSQIINLDKLERILKSNYQSMSDNFTFELELTNNQTNLILTITYNYEFVEWSEQIIFKQKSTELTELTELTEPLESIELTESTISVLLRLIPIVQKQQKQISELMRVNEQMNLKMNELIKINENNQYFTSLTTGCPELNPLYQIRLFPKNFDKMRIYIITQPTDSTDSLNFGSLWIQFAIDNTAINFRSFFDGHFAGRFKFNIKTEIETNVANNFKKYYISTEPSDFPELNEKTLKYLKFINFGAVELICNDDIFDNMILIVVDFINTYCNLDRTEILIEHGTNFSQMISLK